MVGRADPGEVVTLLADKGFTGNVKGTCGAEGLWVDIKLQTCEGESSSLLLLEVLSKIQKLKCHHIVYVLTPQ